MPDVILQEIADKLADKQPGLKVESGDGSDGATLHYLLAPNGDPLLKVIGPHNGLDGGVRVVHFHADASHETEYVFCGPDHDPNWDRIVEVPKDSKLTKEEWDELWKEKEKQQNHTPIDSEEKLRALCTQLLESAESVGILKRSQRMVARMARAKARQEALQARPLDSASPTSVN